MKECRNIMDNSGMHGGDRSGRVMLLIFMKVSFFFPSRICINEN
jgi:hypothetical protein